MATNYGHESYLPSNTNIGLNYTICVMYNSGVKFLKGIHIGKEPRVPDSSVFPYVMLQLILSFFMSRLVYYLLRPLKQPKLVCYILVKFLPSWPPVLYFADRIILLAFVLYYKI